MKLSHLFIFLVLLAVFSWFSKLENKETIKLSGHKIKVGVIVSTQQPNSALSFSGIEGIKISQALYPSLNNGDAVELIVLSDEGIPKKSVQALHQLVKEHQVAAILVFSDSNSVLALSKVADQYKTPILALDASHPDITKSNSFINQFNFDDLFQASIAALYVRDELLIERVAVFIQPNNKHFSYLAHQFSQQFKTVEGEVSNVIQLTDTQYDYIKLLEPVMENAPELLYLMVDVKQIFKIKHALVKLGWEPYIMVSDGILANAKAQTKYPPYLLNNILTIDMFSSNHSVTSLGRRLQKEMNSIDLSIDQIGTTTVLGMEGYAFLMYVINQCLLPKSTVQACINKAIRETKRFEGIQGMISFSDTGKASRSLFINSINAGNLEFIVQVY